MIAEQRSSETSAADVIARHRQLLERVPSNASIADDVLGELDAFIHWVYARGVWIAAEADRRICQSIIDYWSAVLYRAGWEPEDLLLQDFDPSRAPELPDDACPYVGLDAFDQRQADRFFGRRQLVDTLLHQLTQTPVLGVVGPSGSGKSSVVRAGLLPALRRGAIRGSENWRILGPIVPSDAPLDALAHLFAVEAETLRGDPHRLVELASSDAHDPLVLIIDQFEELYVRHLDGVVRLSDDARTLIQALVALVQSPDVTAHVVLTLRSDFESYIELTPDFAPLFRAGQVVVPGLAPAELREAIEKPAAQIGLLFEDGIVDDILRGVVAEPTALPLLQFTLLKLWESRDRNRITWRVYNNVIADAFDTAAHRGPRWVLKHAADKLYYQDLLPEEQSTLQYILLRLVRPAEGSEFVSARVSRQELYHGGGPASDRVGRVLDKLIAARLVRQTPDDQFVEVAHEALVRNWPLLNDWLAEERERLRDRIHLTAAAQAWLKCGRDPKALWRGNQLAQARAFDNLGPLEAEFVAASRKVEHNTLVVRLVGVGLMVAAVVTIVALGINLFILRLQYLDLSTRVARSWALAADAAAYAQTQPDLALLLGLQAYRTEPTPEARDVLLRSAISDARLLKFLRTDPSLESAAIAIRPDSRTVVAAHTAGQFITQLSVWNSETSEPPDSVPLSAATRVSQVAVSPGADRLVVSDASGQLTLWDTNSRTPVARDVQLDSQQLSNLVIGGGERIAFSSADRVGLWQPAMGRVVTTLASGAADVAGLTISADGATVAWTDQCDAACGPALVHLRGTGPSDAERSVNVPGSQGTLRVLALSPDGTTIATADATSGVLLDADRGGNPRQFSPAGKITALTFSADGQQLATGDDRGNVDLWEVSTGRRLGATLQGHTGQGVTSLAFSTDGKRLISAYATAGQPVVVWDLERKYGEPAHGSTPVPSQTPSASSPSGRLVAIGDCALNTPRVLSPSVPTGECTRGDIALSDVQTGQTVHMRGHTDRVTGLAFYGENILASASRDGTVMLWDTETRQALTARLEPLLPAKQDAGVAFTDDGSLVAGSARSSEIWQLDLDLSSVQPRVCAIVNRPLSSDELERFHVDPSENPCP
jgi:WD40 repeat protein